MEMWIWLLVFSAGAMFGVALVLVIMHYMVRWQEREEALEVAEHG